MSIHILTPNRAQSAIRTAADIAITILSAIAVCILLYLTVSYCLWCVQFLVGAMNGNL